MQQKATIFYGWWVLIACAAVQFYFSATVISSFTTLFNPIADEFGWAYALISLAATFRGFEVGFFAPLVGYFVDKFRPCTTISTLDEFIGQRIRLGKYAGRI